MIIDFKKRISTFNFKTGESCQIDIECNFLNNTKEIILEYKFDDLKTLIIQKEWYLNERKINWSNKERIK